jgi:predicted oxidoreductase
VTNQIELSLTAHVGPFTNGDIAFLQERGPPVMAWSPAGGRGVGDRVRRSEGRCSRRWVAGEHGVDRTAVAVAWLLAHPARIIPVMGTNNPARIATIGEALRVPMDRETWFELYTATLGREVA